jgi:hypothetical protein
LMNTTFCRGTKSAKCAEGFRSTIAEMRTGVPYCWGVPSTGVPYSWGVPAKTKPDEMTENRIRFLWKSHAISLLGKYRNWLAFDDFDHWRPREPVVPTAKNRETFRGVLKKMFFHRVDPKRTHGLETSSRHNANRGFVAILYSFVRQLSVLELLVTLTSFEITSRSECSLLSRKKYHQQHVRFYIVIVQYACGIILLF